MAYRPKQLINTYMDPKDFETTIVKDKPKPTQVYLLQEESSYNIQSLTDQVENPIDKK